MKFTIEPYKAKKLPENRVTSHNIFKKGERRVSDDYNYDDNGIFSYKIFGKIGSCRCTTDKKTTHGYCKVCGTRVIDPEHMPFFYIDLETFVPKLCTDYKKFPLAELLLTYKGFLAFDDNGSYLIWEEKVNKKRAKKLSDEGFEEGMEIITIHNLQTKQEQHEHASDYDINKFCKNKKLLLGVDAVKYIYDGKVGLKKWLDTWTTDVVYIPHTTQRSNLKMGNGQVRISELNQMYVDLLQKIHITESYKMDYNYDHDGNNKMVVIDYFLASWRSIYEAYVTTEEKILSLLTDGKKSYLNLNLRSHRITSAIKGTVVNRFDLDEDIVLIGDTFIQTLYPYLYKECDGNMEEINKRLIDNNEIVLVNRAPTICHLSIIACKPRVASCYPFGTFSDGALGYPTYFNEGLDLIDGEVVIDNEPEIDTLGIRTIGVNPVICSGLNLDYDGDQMLIIPLFSAQAKEEGETMLPSKNFMNYANGEIRNGIPEDIEYANSWNDK